MGELERVAADPRTEAAACQWCLAASQQLRAATGDPTARAYCTEHRAPVVGGEEPLRQKIAEVFKRFGVRADLAGADVVLAVIREELELLARYRAQADRPGVVVDDHQVCDEQLREALRALAALADRLQRHLWRCDFYLGRPCTCAFSEAERVLAKLGRGE